MTTGAIRIRFKDGRVAFAADPRDLDVIRQEVPQRAKIAIEGPLGFDGDDKPEEGIHYLYADEIEAIEPL